jgi:hypothetical protein
MPNRRFLPRTEPLEVRALLSTVILADIDTGAVALPSLASSSWPNVPSTPLVPYLTQQFNTLNGPATPEAAVAYSGHGSIMAASYALLMQSTGDRAIVQPIAAGNSSGFTSDTIGRAMQFVASEQAAANAAGTGIRYVVSLPVEPGIWGIEEINGREALAAENVPLSQAAGNSALNFNPCLPMSGELTAEAARTDGSLEPYSNHGTGGTPVVILNDLFGTSGASVSGAAWLAKEIEANPGIAANQAVSTLQNAGILGQYPYAVSPSIPAGPAPLAPAPVPHTTVKPVLRPVHNTTVKLVLRPVHPVPVRPVHQTRGPKGRTP